MTGATWASECGRVTLYHGDCLDVLASLPDGSVDAVVTDPPYELGFMGKTWDGTGIANSVDLWREVLRVLKPGGHLLAFGGTRTYHRMTCAVEDAGFEIRDCLAWMYGSGFPKSLNLDGEREGWGTALKPAHEPIVMARKPLDGTVAANVLRHGTGAINVDGCKVSGGSRPHIQRRNDKTLDGAIYGSGINGSRSLGATDVGRWPANLILDEEAAAMLDEMSGERPGAVGMTQLASSGGLYEGGLRRVDGSVGNNGARDTGGASRFFYTAKASRSEREAGMREAGLREAGGSVRDDGGAQHVGDTRRAANHHPTIKPISLMRWLVRLVTPPGGIVLDPFVGSGTTACATSLEGFRCIGIERDSEYVEIIKARVAHWSRVADEEREAGEAQPSLFEPEPPREEQAALPLVAS